MNKIYFSRDPVGFYIENVSVVPSNAIEVSSDIYNEFAGIAWPAGKILSADNSGNPVWKDAPPLTKDELSARADTEKQLRADEANNRVNGQQWPSKLALGRLSDDEKALFNEWLDYLDAVNAVDTSTAPEIEWPTPPASPAR
ncbi:TPA: tail fiber assembly protein [Morganella morganii]|uniref:tail fiber assembly protein n=1 Tax=Morganella morganii TaxID=582 RepID=UPI00280C77F9|nr:tail fiber assembly protein [Morganella morganii subsp. morganii]HEI7947261.1 tail fiber assembly protein [Morganella morganii]